METIFFSHCWGVFDGGGVRGAAHAGAFHAARESGMNFERLAGTSAGSIVAALIAAGGSPDHISKLLMKTDLATFLSPAVKTDSIYKNNNIYVNFVKYIPFGKFSPIKDILFNSGMHSSYKIQEWLEDELKKLLVPYREKDSKGNIRFNELKIPLHIIATNLSTGLPQVWSTETTPEESVSYAVRCSCSIPFFFQAISDRDSILVDGGVVSNLPSFIFSKLLNDMPAYTKKPNIINFRLVQNTSLSKKPNNIIEYFEKLSNAVVSGSSEVQKILQTSTYNILIDTGDVGSTDFKSVNQKRKEELHQSGRMAVEDFIANERVLFRQGNINAVSQGFDEKMLMLIQQIRDCGNEFFVSGASCSWLDFLFPTIFIALKSGVKITCLIEENHAEKEIRFHYLLRNLGVNVITVNKLPFNGFFFSPFEEHCTAILTTNEIGRNIYEYEKVKIYNYFNDAPIIDLLREKINLEWRAAPQKERCFKYIPCPEQEIFSKLINVHQYRNAKFSIKKIEVNDNIFSMSDSVKEYKVDQIRSFMTDISSSGKDTIDVYKVELLNGISSIITPPVLEKINEKYYVIDGNARLFHFFNKGIKYIKAIVVENVVDSLPSQRSNPLSKLRLTSLTQTMSQNYAGIDKSKFRHIEQAMHPYPPKN